MTLTKANKSEVEEWGAACSKQRHERVNVTGACSINYWRRLVICCIYFTGRESGLPIDHTRRSSQIAAFFYQPFNKFRLVQFNCNLNIENN